MDLPDRRRARQLPTLERPVYLRLGHHLPANEPLFQARAACLALRDLLNEPAGGVTEALPGSAAWASRIIRRTGKRWQHGCAITLRKARGCENGLWSRYAAPQE
jgi:hypothetical protein